ncbi:MAG: citrulline utilization hydrolase CtlX [Labrenzia sp.]
MSKSARSVQAPSSVVLIRPHHFYPNAETTRDNAFQSEPSQNDLETARRAYVEVTEVANKLEECGVKVHLFEDVSSETPDSVFPNNWFSTHPGGHIAIYPMFATNRRRERRQDVIELLKFEYRVQDVIDYSGLEADGLFLEGTGAMVLDHIDRVAYAVRSDRTDPIALERFCAHFGYEPMVFEAHDRQDRPIYHTNVLMCVASEFVLIGSGMIPDEVRRAEIIDRLESSGKRAIELSDDQICNFAGNAIELQGQSARYLALSCRALKALTREQITLIEESAILLPLDVSTIEHAGGSVRCMLAGVHLSIR